MTKNRSSGIPFKADDPRYSRAWYLINKQGKTMEEALFYIADLQKEILAELKIISGTLHRKGP